MKDEKEKGLKAEIPYKNIAAIVNLGCPKFCQGFLCVDKFPYDKRVISADVYEFLRMCSVQGVRYESIYIKNLLEHLGNSLNFLILCRSVLKPGGVMKLVTDNAEFFPYYIPLALVGTGVGGHSTNSYALGMNQSVHLAIFTKLHLKNLFAEAGFERVSIWRLPKVLFARLEAVGFVPT
ncbi:MAG: methyltransferase domain-containing protein [Nitrososphaerales archaeon]